MNKPGAGSICLILLLYIFYLTLQYCLWYCCLIHFIILKCIISRVWQHIWHCTVCKKRKLHSEYTWLSSFSSVWGCGGRTPPGGRAHAGARNGGWGSLPVSYLSNIFTNVLSDHLGSLVKKIPSSSSWLFLQGKSSHQKSGLSADCFCSNSKFFMYLFIVLLY